MVSLCFVIFIIIQSTKLEYFVLSVPLHGSHEINTTRNLDTNQEVSRSTDLNLLYNILTGINNVNPENLLESLINDETNSSLFNQQIFQDIYEPTFKPLAPIKKEIPRCSHGFSICETVDRYPYSYIRNILRKTNDHKDYFGVDEISSEFSNRVGELKDDFMCGSLDVTIFPKAGMNKHNEWKYIINQDDQYVQGIRVEKCIKVGNPCNLIMDTPVGYVTSCKQKFVLRRLLSLSGNGNPEPDSFYIPSACCCSVRKDIHFLTEFKSFASKNTTRT